MTTDSQDGSTVLFHNIVAPYRNKLFEEISDSINLTVYFSKSNNKDRYWESSPENYNYKSRMLKGFEIGPFIINPFLWIHLLRDDPETVIAVETLQTVVSTFMLVILTKLTGSSLVLWSGVFEDEYKYKRSPEMIHNIDNAVIRNTILSIFRIC
ncbi:hypothetical protein, partial [Halobellus sp. Atlit-38R]